MLGLCKSLMSLGVLETLGGQLQSYLLEIEVLKLRYRRSRENFDIEVLNFDIEVFVYVADIQAALGFPTATGMHVDASQRRTLHCVH